MGALLRMFRRKDAEAQKREQETAEKERKAGVRHGRLSKSQLKSWEGKYGVNGETTSGSSDERVLFAPDLAKVRSDGSGSTFVSIKQGPVDILPNFDYVPPSVGVHEGLVHTPPTPPLAPTAVKRMSTLSSRPVLAPLQPSATTPASPEWDRYLSSRTLSVASNQAHSVRPSRTLSMYSLADPAHLAAARASSTSPIIQLQLAAGEGHAGRLSHEDLVVDDDDIPLAVAAAVRTRSSPILPRPSTMYDLSASPSFTTQQGNYSSPVLPRSHSRAASLSIPAILAQPVTPPLPLAASPLSSAILGSLGKGATLLDLHELSKVDVYQQRAGRSGPQGGDERIVIGDRSRAGKKREEKPKTEGPKVLDFEELENRHKKRMSMLQTTATDHLTTEAAKKRFQQQQQREAEQQRRKEAETARRRSVSSNLHLAAGPGSSSKGSRSPTVDDFGVFKANAASDAPRRSSTSMSGLSALLKFGGSPGSSSDPSTPSEYPFPMFAPPLASTRARRQSTLALVQPVDPPSKSSSSSSTPSGSSSSATPAVAPVPRNRPPRPNLAANRRHSLGTLLEASYEASLVAASDEDRYGADLEPPARPFAFAPHGWSRGGREPGPEKRVEKVQEWRRRSSSEHSLSRPGSLEGSRNASSTSVGSEKTRVKGKGEFGLLSKTAGRGKGTTLPGSTGTEGTAKKKKHDWLAY
ncbi:hypothetical protein JCM11251_004379 [Rhodosporidiobolus azoricus]